MSILWKGISESGYHWQAAQSQILGVPRGTAVSKWQPLYPVWAQSSHQSHLGIKECLVSYLMWSPSSPQRFSLDRCTTGSAELRRPVQGSAAQKMTLDLAAKSATISTSLRDSILPSGFPFLLLPFFPHLPPTLRSYSAGQQTSLLEAASATCILGTEAQHWLKLAMALVVKCLMALWHIQSQRYEHITI